MTFSRGALAAGITAAALLPIVAFAQAQTDLSSTIRAELLSDPRTSTLTQSQLDAMVSVLTDKAQAQGITAQNIVWHPGMPASAASFASTASANVCEGTADIACMFDTAFGFLGPDTLIAYLLGLSSMGLIWILAEMLHHHKYGTFSHGPQTPVVQ